MTAQQPESLQTDRLCTKLGRLLIATWMVGILAYYLQLLLSRIVSIAETLP